MKQFSLQYNRARTFYIKGRVPDNRRHGINFIVVALTSNVILTNQSNGKVFFLIQRLDPEV